MKNQTERILPDLSVCTTNYNCAHALSLHLASIYEQLGEQNFEYICVDNYSRDKSGAILSEWQSTHANFRWLPRSCSKGRGREIAVGLSSGSHILVVDTDTVYLPILRNFVNRVLREMPNHAVQAIYAGLYPRHLWQEVGGAHNLNVGEDFDLWMRIWKMGRMKWYPVPMGVNWKNPAARDAADYLSNRYSRLERVLRFARGQFDYLRLTAYRGLDLEKIWRTNSVDLGLAPLQESWFERRAPGTLVNGVETFLCALLQVLTASPMTDRAGDPGDHPG